MMPDDEAASKRQTANLLVFSPEHWGEVERFSRFWNTTYSFDRVTQKRLRGIIGHFSKAGYLFNLARRLSSGLDEDERQLEAHGHSPAHHAKELASVVETVLCELYSTLDCARAVLRGVFPKHKGIRKSTRSTFQNAYKDEITDEVPEPIREALKQTEQWYPDLLKLRDEITHSNVGSCHQKKEMGEIFYMHDGLGSPGKALVIENIFDRIGEYFDLINQLLGSVFRELNAALDDSPLEQICGFFGGRIYQRVVRPSEAIDIHGGLCISHKWFDFEDNPDCPLKDGCNAYSQAKAEAEGSSASG